MKYTHKDYLDAWSRFAMTLKREVKIQGSMDDVATTVDCAIKHKRIASKLHSIAEEAKSHAKLNRFKNQTIN